MPILNNFRENIVAACAKAKISQAELARRSGVHFVTVNRIFKGVLSPSVEICEKLAEAAGIQPEKSFSSPRK